MEQKDLKDKNELKDISLEKAQKIIRVKKPRPFRTIFFGFLAILVITALAWGVRSALLVTKIVSSNDSDSSFFDLPFLDWNGGLRGEKEGRINILLIGIGGTSHPKGSNLADSIIFASIDTKSAEKQITMINLPRDLLVKMPKPLNGEQKINAVHSYGEQSKEATGGGPAMMKKVIEEITGQEVHYWLRIDFTGFEKLVDSVGGITVDVPKDIYDQNYPAENLIDYNPFYLKAGTQRMNGKTALKYARSRYSTSDFDRSNRQQQIIQAIKKEFENKGYIYRPDKIIEILEVLSKYLKTDLSPHDFKALYDMVKNIPNENIKSVILDNSATGPFKTFSNGGYYLVPKTGDWLELQDIIENIFIHSSIRNEVTIIEIQDASGQSICASLSQILTASGYQIVTCSKTETIAKTHIYDFAQSQKPKTIEDLRTRFTNAKIFPGEQYTSNLPLSKKTDFLIIIGTDYEPTTSTNKKN